jgi:hypothetical protein
MSFWAFLILAAVMVCHPCWLQNTLRLAWMSMVIAGHGTVHPQDARMSSLPSFGCHARRMLMCWFAGTAAGPAASGSGHWPRVLHDAHTGMQRKVSLLRRRIRLVPERNASHGHERRSRR